MKDHILCKKYSEGKGDFFLPVSRGCKFGYPPRLPRMKFDKLYNFIAFHYPVLLPHGNQDQSSRALDVIKYKKANN
ncbi:hypothetical protein L1049_021203 [Liquidambar formosana]|uniref:Uncharacterized protein n=1 Tax=Liquidambar formosana TaxID=63359 RepID=A0AAP0X4W6_LIQFO